MGTNLAVVPGVRTALSLGATVGSAPAVVLALNGAASAVYHMCDLEVCDRASCDDSITEIKQTVLIDFLVLDWSLSFSPLVFAC